MQKFLFIDRDGTIVKEPKGYELSQFDQLEFYPFVFQYLGWIVKEMNYKLVMVSNQDGLGSESFREEDFFRVHDFVMKCFENEGIVFDEVLIDRTFPSDKKDTRKPGIGMLKHYLNNKDIDIANSFVIGDRITDVQMAKNLGCQAIWLNNRSGLGMKEITCSMEELNACVALDTEDWERVYEFLKEWDLGASSDLSHKSI